MKLRRRNKRMTRIISKMAAELKTDYILYPNPTSSKCKQTNYQATMLQSCSFTAPYIGVSREKVLYLMQQIIFSETGIIDVYECCVREYCLSYQSGPAQAFAIQRKIDYHLPAILALRAKEAVLRYLFDHALYVNSQNMWVQFTRLQAV